MHEDVILLLSPESFRVLLSRANWDFCYLKLTGIIKFKYKRKSEKILVVSKMSPSCKWPVRKHIILMWPITNYMKKQNKTKQNKNTHADKQSRFSYLTIPKLFLERNFTYLLTNSLGQGSAASLLAPGVLDLRPVDGSFLKRSDELRTSVALLLLSSTTAIKKEWNTVKASWDFQLRRSVTLSPTSSSTIP